MNMDFRNSEYFYLNKQIKNEECSFHTYIKRTKNQNSSNL